MLIEVYRGENYNKERRNIWRTVVYYWKHKATDEIWIVWNLSYLLYYNSKFKNKVHNTENSVQLKRDCFREKNQISLKSNYLKLISIRLNYTWCNSFFPKLLILTSVFYWITHTVLCIWMHLYDELSALI